MKLTTFVSLLTISGAVSGGVLQHDILNRRQGLAGTIIEAAAKAIGAGKVADPPGAAPRRIESASPIKLPGAKRVTIRAGPYAVPNMGKKSLNGHAGMLENYPDNKVEKPCSDECTLLQQQAGLEYPDGSNANINTGLWLHHMVHFVSGPSRWDAAGIGGFCLPHFGLGVSPATAERFFASGNERSILTYNMGTDMSSGTGYHINKEDKFMYMVELMNMNMEDKIVYVTMTYDIIEGKALHRPLPTGWNDMKMVYLGPNQCSTSEVVPPQETGSFTISSKPWTPTYEGKIVSIVGHLHDGGRSLDITTNPDKTLCRTTTKYAETPEYIFKGMSMGDDKTTEKHISSMDGCKPDEFTVKEMKKDQSWTINGNYDYGVHEGNIEKGKQMDIMATVVVMVQVPPGPVAKPTNRVVANMMSILTGQKITAKAKQISPKADKSRDLFLRVADSPTGLCVARVSAPMDTCKAI
ncbi:hypothetical protein EG328_010709 [Venturia inaequalis]|uniref:Uncharacterized protein n=1 Tax=Venturia inaequalis TaxID=5025 RepID=A0A8H3V7T8_VENIN|nr:hypothetical protein EG328_010709 [Venturia inaequalis]